MDNSTVVLAASVAITFISAVSPFITAWMNNRHQVRMKRIELYDFRQAEAISSYIRATGAYIQDPRQQTAADYGKCYGEIFLYAPEYLWDAIAELNTKVIYRRSSDELYADLNQICMELNRWQAERGKHIGRIHDASRCCKHQDDRNDR